MLTLDYNIYILLCNVMSTFMFHKNRLVSINRLTFVAAPCTALTAAPATGAGCLPAAGPCHGDPSEGSGVRVGVGLGSPNPTVFPWKLAWRRHMGGGEHEGPMGWHFFASAISRVWERKTRPRFGRHPNHLETCGRKI